MLSLKNLFSFINDIYFKYLFNVQLLLLSFIFITLKLRTWYLQSLFVTLLKLSFFTQVQGLFLFEFHIQKKRMCSSVLWFRYPFTFGFTLKFSNYFSCSWVTVVVRAGKHLRGEPGESTSAPAWSASSLLMAVPQLFCNLNNIMWF